MSSRRHHRAKEVIETILGTSLKQDDLFEATRDGTLLGNLADSLNKTNLGEGDGVSRFCAVCKLHGVEDGILITLQDLEDRRVFEKVIDCILYLSTKLQLPKKLLLNKLLLFNKLLQFLKQMHV